VAVGVSIFDSVRFLLEKTNQTKFLFFLNSELKPIQTDHFQFGSVRFGSVRLIKEKNWKKPILSSYVSYEGHVDANKWRRSMMN
jgi:hypothetical protein